MKISSAMLLLKNLFNEYGDIQISLLIHKIDNNKNYLGTAENIYYDELSNSLEIFGFFNKEV